MSLLAGTIWLCLPALALDWHKYTSEHFVLYSDGRPAGVEKLLVDTEVFRAVSMFLLGMEESDAPLPVTIVMFSDGDGFDMLGESTDMTGLYRTTRSGAVVLYAPSLKYSEVGNGLTLRQKSSPKAAIQHQLLHHLLRVGWKRPLPYWYEYGLTLLYSMSDIGRYRVTVGSVPSYMESEYTSGRTVSVREVLRHQSLWSLEYDASVDVTSTTWMLAHYLFINPGDGAEHRNRSRARAQSYIDSWTPASSQFDLFEKSFETSTDDLDAELQRYRDRGSLPVLRFKRPAIDVRVDVRKLDSADVDYALARIAFELGNHDHAARLLVRHRHGASVGMRAQLLGSIVEAAQGRKPEACGSLSEHTRSDESKIALLLAELAWHCATSADVSDAAATDLLRLAVSWSDRAIAESSIEPTAHWLRGMALSRLGSDVDAAESLMTAFATNPSHPDLNLDLARFLDDFGRADLAVPFTERARGWAVSEDVRGQADDIVRR